MTIDKSLFSGFAAALLVIAAAVQAWNPVTAASAVAPVHRFVKRAEAETHQMPSALSRILLTADETNGRYSIIDEEFQPEMASFPHLHTFHSETFLIVSGEMEWSVGGEKQTLGPGDLVYIPPDVSHSTRVVGDKPAHAIMISEPAGYEQNLRRRVSLTPEQRRDPETRRRLMELSDVVPQSAAGRDF